MKSIAFCRELRASSVIRTAACVLVDQSASLRAGTSSRVSSITSERRHPLVGGEVSTRPCWQKREPWTRRTKTVLLALEFHINILDQLLFRTRERFRPPGPRFPLLPTWTGRHLPPNEWMPPFRCNGTHPRRCACAQGGRLIDQYTRRRSDHRTCSQLSTECD